MRTTSPSRRRPAGALVTTLTLTLAGAALTAALTAPRLDAQTRKPAAAAAAEAGFAPGARVLVDAHNAYPSDGRFTDRIDRALSTGLPMAIEQDLVWYTDPASGQARSVVSHGGKDSATAPTFEAYFFEKVKPIMEKALAENRRADWPLIVLNLDFKTNEPAHHAAVWALLGKYEAWLTTAERTATGDTPAPLRVGPMLVLTGSNDRQQAAFHDEVPVGQRLRLFGAIQDARADGADAKARALNYAQMPVDSLIAASRTNYRRWANFSWGVIEAGGAAYAETWTPAEATRLRDLVARAHAKQLWIRFYTLNGHSKEEGASAGLGGFYNFGAPEAAAIRWKAAVEASTDFIATDQYEALAKLKAGLPPTARTPNATAAR